MSEPVSTGCPPLDDLLGGGFERGTVTQVYGPPAAGKTNLALSAAVQVGVDAERGSASSRSEADDRVERRSTGNRTQSGDGGIAVYIDTEGLSTDRFRQLIDAVAVDDDVRDSITSRLVVSEAHDFAEQEEAVRDTADFAPRADLIVLDSATGFYRLERTDGDEGETLRRVGRQVTHLLSLARKHDLAVVVTNQVFTDPEGDRVRALGGNTLDHWTGTILRLDRFRGGNRRATLEKHRSKAAGETATFRITGEGLAATAEGL